MILALRALGIGDLLTAVPAMRALRAVYPGRTLVLATPRWLEPLVDLIGGVDRVVPCSGLDEPLHLSLPSGPDPAVNLHGRGPESHRLLRVARPKRLWAFAYPAAGHHDGPPWIEDEHEVLRWCRLLDWYGVPADPSDLGLHRPPRSRIPYGRSVVHPGGKDRRRRWSPERFAAVARALDRMGHHVVITGSTAERTLAEYVAERAGLASRSVLAGRLGLPDLAAAIADARIVVSADTGAAHLATGYGTPSVLLFGPEPPRRWGPPPERRWHRVLWREDLAGQPFQPTDGAGIHPALAAISVDEVLTAVAVVDRSGERRHAVTTG